VRETRRGEKRGNMVKVEKAKLLTVYLATFLLVIGGGVLSALAENEDCLGCHGDTFIIDDGGPRLYIDQSKFDNTVHAEMGCETCHETVTAEHPDDGNIPSKASCGDCHDTTAEVYDQSVHSGNAACADCHNPHAVKGLLVLSGFQADEVCDQCHDRAEMTAKHDEWLPRAQLHMQAVPCITCHTTSKDYVITMYLEKLGPKKQLGHVELATYQDLSPLAEGKDIKSIIDENGDGLISLPELREFNTSETGKKVRLWGMMTAESIVHKFDIMNNRWDCTFCHASGPKAMQTSYVAFPNQDGTYTRVDVEKGAVLDMLIGTPDFYMMGATRNEILSVLGILIIAGGMCVPLVHGTFRFLTRKNRRHH
jgi:predicted CXXCH cytochrome family protein